MTIRIAAAVVALCFATGAAAVPIQERYSALVVTGTSISDAGNLFRRTTEVFPFLPDTPAIPGLEPQDERYFQGRFSNGPVWADHVGDLFDAADKQVINVAHGGAKTRTDLTPPAEPFVPDLPEQIGLAALELPRFGSRPLGVVEFGPNDIFEAIEGGDLLSVADAARNVLGGVQALAALGVEDFAVFNVVNLGLIPRYARYLPDLVDEATAATRAFNDVLESGLAALRAPDLRLDLIDAEALFDDFFADPEQFGVVDLINPCISVIPPVFTPFEGSPEPEVCDDATGLAFFDGNHIEAGLHAALADAFIETLDPRPAPIPLAPALPMLVAALLPMAWLGRRA